MSKRTYTHVKHLLPIIEKMQENGKTQQQIADHFGFKDKFVIKRLLTRSRKKALQSIPQKRERKPAKTLSEYKYENKRLQMENELLRDFLQSTERM